MARLSEKQAGQLQAYLEIREYVQDIRRRYETQKPEDCLPRWLCDRMLQDLGMRIQRIKKNEEPEDDPTIINGA